MKSVNILGIEISDLSQAEALSRVKNYIEDAHQHYIVTPNPEIVLKAKKDKSRSLRLILNHADLSLPDGFGLKIAARLLGEKINHRITGADFSEAIIALAEQEKWPIFLLGAKNEKVSERAAWHLRYKYKQVKIVGHASGGVVEFKQGRIQSSDDKLLDKINKSRAKIIFIGFGCPKQEKWIFQNLDKLPNIKLAMTVGGTLDFFAGQRKRALYFLRKIGLEWLWRLISERGHAKRIYNAIAVFLWTTLKWRLRMTRYRKNAAAFIVNNKNEVFLVKRSDSSEEHWQMPQGGVDKGETDEEAVIRETQEETGIKNIEIIDFHPINHKYEFPTKWHKLNNGYKGQKQTIFYLKYFGDESDILLDNREAADYSWVALDDVERKVYEKRKQMSNMAVNGYKQILHDKKQTTN